MLAAANEHLSSRGQSDTLNAHLEFPSAASAGCGIVVVDEVKLGRQLSRLHLTLWQGGILPRAPWINPSLSRRTVLAYTIHANLRNFEGISLPTGYEVNPANALLPLPELQTLVKQGTDGHWEKLRMSNLRISVPSLHNWESYIPRRGLQTPGVLDRWMRLASGERITQKALPYAVDVFPATLMSFLMSPETRKLLEASPIQEKETEKKLASLWYATLEMNLEVKKVLPEERVEWLNLRVTSKQIKDGRFDLEVVVRDLKGELVALSHQVALIISTEKEKRSGKAVL